MGRHIVGNPKEEPSFCFGTDLNNMIKIHPDGSVTLPENMPADDAAAEFWDEVVKYGIEMSADYAKLYKEKEDLEHTVTCMKKDSYTLQSKYNKACGLLQYFIDRVNGGSIQSTVTYQKFKDFLERN